MARPRKTHIRTAAEIEATILEEGEQLALLQRDLRDALMAGEDTRPYRRAVSETEANIAGLRTALEDARQADALLRHATCAAEASAIVAEAHARHAALLVPLTPPSFPIVVEGA